MPGGRGAVHPRGRPAPPGARAPAPEVPSEGAAVASSGQVGSKVAGVRAAVLERTYSGVEKLSELIAM